MEPESKWVLRSRRAWAWLLGVATIIAGLDALTLDLILPHVAALLGLEPEVVAAVRGRALSLAAIVALALAAWRKSRPDDRTRTVIPEPVRALLDRPPGQWLLALALVGSIACAAGPGAQFVALTHLGTAAERAASTYFDRECSDAKVRADRAVAALCLERSGQAVLAQIALESALEGYRSTLAAGGNTAAKLRAVRVAICNLAAAIPGEVPADNLEPAQCEELRPSATPAPPEAAPRSARGELLS